MYGDPLDESPVFPIDGRRHVEACNVPSSLDANLDDISKVQRVVDFDASQVAQSPMTSVFVVIRMQNWNQSDVQWRKLWIFRGYHLASRWLVFVVFKQH